MTKNRYLNIFLICLGFFMLISCTMSANKAPEAIPSLAYTQAVQTIVVHLTNTPSVPTLQVTPTVQPTEVKPTIVTPSPVLPTATPSQEVSATPVISPEVTQILPVPLANLGDPDWQETFDGTGTWYLYQDDFISLQAKDNMLEMTALQANSRNGWVLAPQLVSDEFFVELVATIDGNCRGRDRYGLILSPVSSADKCYLLGLSCEGKYILWKWDGKKMTVLVEWTPNPIIEVGSNTTNRIGLKVQNNQLSLYANNTLLAEVTENTYKLLYFGIFIGASDTTNFTVVVDKINYWSLP